MKKNFLLSMIIMLMTTISSFAQKEYNMVITLNNGTTITLGHNDIKEITFNDGQVSISGNVVNTIDSIANAGQNLENIVWNRLAENMDMIKLNQDEIEQNRKMLDQLNQVIEVNRANIAANQDAIKENSARIEEQTVNSDIRYDNLVANIAYVYSIIEKYHPEEAKSKEYKAVKEAIAAAKKK